MMKSPPVINNCCTSGVPIPLQNSLDSSSKNQWSSVPTKRKPSQARFSRLASKVSSFKKSLTSSAVSGIGSDDNSGKSISRVSASAAAQLVAAEYFGEGEPSGNAGPDDGLQLPSTSSMQNDDGEEDGAFINLPEILKLREDNGTPATARTASMVSIHSQSFTSSVISAEDALALEVGQSAHEYLEDCFYTEVSVLDREKFDAVPEVIKSDFVITTHLGKGSYSDVFEIVFKGGFSAAPVKADAGGSIPSRNELHRRRSSRGRRSSLAQSMTAASAIKSALVPTGEDEQCPSFAMKCLRPQIRSDANQFHIGAEDLVHETAILSNLDHPNIIKLHGRASGNLSNAFMLNDGYFILLDRLSETLTDRISTWIKSSSKYTLQGPSAKQIDVAHTIAEAVAYLHSKNIVFRDLKPQNVGFDSKGVLKLFDFGFAIGLPERDKSNPYGLLFDKCGTPRYMGPEVGLETGYGTPADVYSFGILLWEICALEKPFANWRSNDSFGDGVWRNGVRPTIKKRWSTPIKELMALCWDTNPDLRPTMAGVKAILGKVNPAEDKKSILGGRARIPMVKRNSDFF